MAKKSEKKSGKRPTTTISQTAQHHVPSPLSNAEHESLRAQALDTIFSLPLYGSQPPARLHDAANLAAHRATLEDALIPYIDALTDQWLGLQRTPHRTDELHEAQLTPQDYLDRAAAALAGIWHDLWHPSAPPFDAGKLRNCLEEQCERPVYELLYPLFCIPPSTRLAMFDRALARACSYALPDGTPFTKTDFYHDPHRLALMEDAFRQLADRHLVAAQNRLPLILEPHHHVTKGDKKLPTFAAERDKWHAVRQSMASFRKRKGEALEPVNLRDEYALFASLEEVFGTEATATIGAAIWERFAHSIAQQINQFKKHHGLDKPYHFKGATPQLG